MVGVYVEDVADHHRIVGVWFGPLCEAAPGYGGCRRVLCLVGNCLVSVHFNGEVVFLLELLVAVNLHAGLVAKLGQPPAHELLQSVGNGNLLFCQGGYDLADLFRSHSDSVRHRSPLDPLVDGVNPDAAHHDVILCLPPFRQLIQRHDLGRCHVNRLSVQLEMMHFLLQLPDVGLSDHSGCVFLGLLHDGDVLVLGPAQHTEQLLSGLAQAVEITFRGQHPCVYQLVHSPDGSTVVSTVPLSFVVCLQTFRHFQNGFKLGSAKHLVGGVDAGLHRLQRVPHRGQLREIE